MNDFVNLKQEIEKGMRNINNETKKIEEILSTCVSIAYLEIIMFENFKDECEMCCEKAKKALVKMVGDEGKSNIIIEKAKDWIKIWVNEGK